MRYSRPPASCFIFHTNAALSGAYCTLPVDAYHRHNIACQSYTSLYEIGGSAHYSELRCVGVVRHGDVYLNVVRCTPTLELGFNFYHVLHSTAFVMLDLAWLIMFIRCSENSIERTYGSFDPDERLDRCRDAVRHELKLSVRRDERDRAIVLESREPDTLVELDILHLDCLSSSSCVNRGQKGH